MDTLSPCLEAYVLCRKLLRDFVISLTMSNHREGPAENFDNPLPRQPHSRPDLSSIPESNYGSGALRNSQNYF